MPMKLYYFDLYGRAEPIRMALNKAGVEFEDVRLSGQTWMDFKPKCEFGQMPILELEDGTMLSQSAPILNYVGRKYNLVPTDAMDLWKGESFVNYTFEDVFMKVGPALFSKDEDRAEKVKELAEKYFVPWMALLATRLEKTKFLCGETMSVYDMSVAGVLCNLVTNPTAIDAEYWKTLWATAPARVVKYHEDFNAEMKDYLDKRNKGSTM